MPYIKQEDRQDYAPSAHGVPDAETAGQLNFQITDLINAFLYDPEPPHMRQSYEKYNAAIGALECAKLELYRRLVAPYEDEKIAENGDVYL